VASQGKARRFKVGIDVGGTFTDFFVREAGRAPVIHKVLSTPADPSIGVLAGLRELAGALEKPLDLATFLGDVEVIVHGTTVTTNATLTRRGAKTGLITTAGLRDALEMRRGVREERYNNRYTNVAPVVPRYLRIGVQERLDRRGRTLEPLKLDDVRQAIALFKAEGVKAVAICFMNAFANPAHEAEAAALVRQELPGAFLTTSTELLPAIRFYDRISTTALNAYVGPILDHYLAQLQKRLGDAGFAGALLIMQSNGGVMTPEVARKSPALTLLSGPAGGPIAGLAAARPHGKESCIVVDMGGTSFEAALVEKTPVVIKEGEIDRLRCALPMLGIHTIGAGALRSDLQRAQFVDPGDAAAARAHFDDIDHRAHHRVAVGVAADVIAFGRERLALAHQRRLGGGAAHVEGHDVVVAQRFAYGGRGDDAADRARFHHHHRPGDRRGGRHHPAVRLHDREVALEADLA